MKVIKIKDGDYEKLRQVAEAEEKPIHQVISELLILAEGKVDAAVATKSQTCIFDRYDKFNCPVLRKVSGVTTSKELLAYCAKCPTPKLILKMRERAWKERTSRTYDESGEFWWDERSGTWRPKWDRRW